MPADSKPYLPCKIHQLQQIEEMSFTTAARNLSGLIQAGPLSTIRASRPQTTLSLNLPLRCLGHAPTHDNTCDCMIIHRPICQPGHFQAPDRWCRHVCLGAHQRIIVMEMAACLPSSDSAANLTYTAFKVIYGPVVGSTGSLHCGSIPCEMRYRCV